MRMFKIFHYHLAGKSGESEHTGRGCYSLVPSGLRLWTRFGLWSWAGSNRRPNKKLKCFLHAYPVIDCREKTGSRQPVWTLVPLFSPGNRNLYRTIPTFLVPLDQTPSGKASERQLVPTPGAGIIPGSVWQIRQRARYCFRQLIVCNSVLRGKLFSPACLQINSSCCQIHVSPIFLGIQRYKINTTI